MAKNRLHDNLLMGSSDSSTAHRNNGSEKICHKSGSGVNGTDSVFREVNKKQFLHKDSITAVYIYIYLWPTTNVTKLPCIYIHRVRR